MRSGAVLTVAALLVASAARSGDAPPSVPFEETAPARSPVDAALLARVVAAAGGADAIASLRGFRARGRVLPLVDGPVEQAAVVLDLRGAMREETRVAGVTRRKWLSGRLAWESGHPPRLASATATEEVRRRFHELAAPFELCRASADSMESAGASPEGWVRIILRTEGRRLRYDVDPQSGHVRRFAQEPTPGPDPAPLVEIELDDFRTVDGLAWPFRATTLVEGRPGRETIWERFQRADDLVAQEFLPRASQSGL